MKVPMPMGGGPGGPPFGGRRREGGPESSRSEHHGPRHERSLEDIMKTVWLTPENAVFFRCNGLLYLSLNEKEIRVSLRRDFPFEELWSHISVLDESEEEVGIISSLDLFDGEAGQLLREELERRYYAPVIRKILGLKERYGFSYWKVETAEGTMEFTLHDTYKSLIRVGGNRVVLLDVDGNRFEIPDVSALDRKSYRKIELYL